MLGASSERVGARCRIVNLIDGKPLPARPSDGAAVPPIGQSMTLFAAAARLANFSTIAFSSGSRMCAIAFSGSTH